MPGNTWQAMRAIFVAAVLMLATSDAHSQHRACGRDPALAEITYVCGKSGGYVRLTDVVRALNAKLGTQRYATISEVHLFLHGAATVPTSEAAFLRWVKEHGGLEVASRDKEMIVLRLPSSWIKP